MFESLARKMNSAQNMNPAIGFNATLTFITYPQKGGKGPASKNPNRLLFDLMHKKKDCMIKITNSDDLCCARAIVTMKAYVDGTYKQYDILRRGRNIQERLAKQLHREANVPEGACGFEELKNFQEYLGPKGYKIILVDYVSCACIFQGNVDEYDKLQWPEKYDCFFESILLFFLTVARDITQRKQRIIPVWDVAAQVVNEHVLRKIKWVAHILPLARNVQFTAKTASVISTVQTV